MGLFDGRSQLPIPEEAKILLRKIPPQFLDDGCSNSPDSIFGFNLRWACRIHDWYGCTRCHLPGSRTLTKMKEGNRLFRKFVGASLPYRWAWIKWVYYYSVKRFNGDESWDSCGSEAGFRCRHNMPRPEWMK